MKYRFILFFMLAVNFYAHAQLIPRPLPNSTGVGFYEFRPADYNTSTYKHPAIIFLGGLGERGNGTTDLPNLLIASIPYFIEKKATMRFTTQDGITQSFVVLIPQLPKALGDWQNSYIDAMINYAALDSKLDMNRIFLIGYSLGGGGCWRYVTTGTGASKIAGIIPMAGSDGHTGNDLCLIAQNRVAVWGMHADDDPQISFTTLTNGVNGVNNGCSPLVKAKASVYDGGSHGPAIWNDRAADTTNRTHFPNIYQWMIKVSRSLNPATNQPPIANAGLDLVFDVPVKDKTIILNALGSTDPDDLIAEYKWERLTPDPFPPRPTYFLSGAMGEFYLGSDTSILQPVPSIRSTKNDRALMLPGTYRYRLTVTDYKGATSTDEKVITVQIPAVANILPGVVIGNDKVLRPDETQTGWFADVIDWTPPGGTPGGIVDHQWRQISGPQTVNVSWNQIIGNVTNIIAAGVYRIELAVTDNQGGISKDTATITKLGPAGPLPVTLSYFKGKNNASKNNLSWATTDEVDNDRFEIQRSTDGTNFSTIGSVAGKGTNSGLTEYYFDDENPVKGVNYYRLRQVDINGKFTLSAVITVTISTKGFVLEHYPNPVHDLLTLRVEGNVFGNIRVLITDIQGRAVSQKTIRKDGALLQNSIEVRQLQSGVYQLELLFADGKKEVRSFVKN